MGGSFRGGVPLSQIRSRGPAVGKEEKQQQYDLREAQQGDEVPRFKTIEIIAHLLKANLNVRFVFEGITTSERSWSGLTDADSSISSAGMLEDGESLKSEGPTCIFHVKKIIYNI